MKLEIPIGQGNKRPRSNHEFPGAVSWQSGFRSILALVVVVMLGCFVQRAAAQTFAIDWFTIDGGGGTSTSAVYSVSGTIGQPDTGRMTGGPYELIGGFWAIYAIQTPGAPTLSIVRTGPGAAELSWEPDAPGWILQETTDLNPSPPVWTNSPSGGTNPVTVPANPPVMKFYRLIKP